MAEIRFARPTVIVGVPRSGTTWLLDMLSEHPQVHGVFESWMFTSDKGFGGLFTQPQWSPRFAARQVATIGRIAGIAQMTSFDEVLEDLRVLVHGWLLRAAPASTTHVVMKELGMEDIPRIAAVFPEARFIHLVRDGRDVVASQRAAARSWAPEIARDRPVGAVSLIRRWRADVMRTESLLRSFAQRTLTVQYEHLLRAPQGSLSRIFDFCELPHSSPLLDTVVAATDFAKLPVVGDGSFRRRGQSGSWRSELPPRVAKVCTAVAADVLKRYGYEVGRGAGVTGSALARAVAKARVIRAQAVGRAEAAQRGRQRHAA